ncbi:DUF7402 domain-containing protein [Cohnella soli]|uniref:RICIN domain-containing protein n=1 Tax=Cohnella soli TaxID=425005 RepID=A0ABW0HNE5_9BACL
MYNAQPFGFNRKAVLLLLVCLLLIPAIWLRPSVASAATNVSADFTVNNGTGHPYVFGAAIGGVKTTMLDSLQQSGMNLVRRDAYLSEIVPKTTIEDYKNNVGNVADPANWDWSKYGWVDEYHNRGIKIMLIISYVPDWLTFVKKVEKDNHYPPKDLTVYRDIVTKIYAHFQGKVDYVEIWNEPDTDWFMNLTDSPYATDIANHPKGTPGECLTAYKDIYEAASLGVRSVDATIPIGGPAVFDATLTNWATSMLSDNRIKNNVDFLTYHDYQTNYNPVETVTAWQSVAASSGKPNIPVFVTEWNYGGDPHPMNGASVEAISYVGNRLTNMYKQHAAGSTIFANDDFVTWPDYFGVYDNGDLTPRASAYRLMSVDLGLGSGDSVINSVSFGSPIKNAGAATNANGDKVVWLVNDGTSQTTVNLNVAGLGSISSAYANIYEASERSDATSTAQTVPVAVSGGNTSVAFNVPAKSIVGVLFSSAPYQNDFNLATTAAASASSQSSANYAPSKVADGIIGIQDTGEWASNGETNPWIKLTWASSQAIGKIVLYDRNNSVDNVNGGMLTFSDGSSINVTNIPQDGSARPVYFPTKNVTWVKFQAVGGVGLNGGLSEFQAMRGDNVAPQATVNVSSHSGNGLKGKRAIDGNVGQASGEWTSNGETNPWIRLDWVFGKDVNQVVLFDRVSASDNVNGGTLTFSDGSSVVVSGIPTDGSAKVVTFPTKTVNWIKFQASGGAGANVGLSEIQVMAADQPDSNVLYKITNKNSGKVLAISASSLADGANAIQWSYLSIADQKWKLIPLSSSTYAIVNWNSNYVLSTDGSYTKGVSVVQKPNWSAGDQRWVVYPVGGGYYKITNARSRQVLAISQASTANGTNAVQWPDSNDNEQIWKIEPAN